MPCASPANFSRQRRIQSVRRLSGTPSLTSSLLLPKSPEYLQAITQTWNARFQVNVPIPYAGFRMGVANVGARAELVGDVSRMVISTHIAIGACASVRVGWFEREWCNPSALTWLPVRVLQRAVVRDAQLAHLLEELLMKSVRAPPWASPRASTKRRILGKQPRPPCRRRRRTRARTRTASRPAPRHVSS
jgi:hypothetical protein